MAKITIITDPNSRRSRVEASPIPLRHRQLRRASMARTGSSIIPMTKKAEVRWPNKIDTLVACQGLGRGGETIKSEIATKRAALVGLRAELESRKRRRQTAKADVMTKPKPKAPPKAKARQRSRCLPVRPR